MQLSPLGRIIAREQKNLISAEIFVSYLANYL
jgi:hypothetical protein